MGDGRRNKLVNVVVGSASGQCFQPVIVSSVHLDDFFTLENNLIGYTDDSPLIAVMP